MIVPWANRQDIVGKLHANDLCDSAPVSVEKFRTGRGYTYGIRLGWHKDPQNAEAEIWDFPIALYDISDRANSVPVAFPLTPLKFKYDKLVKHCTRSQCYDYILA